jgi:hypothetical protein
LPEVILETWVEILVLECVALEPERLFEDAHGDAIEDIFGAVLSGAPASINVRWIACDNADLISSALKLLSDLERQHLRTSTMLGEELMYCK